MSQAIPQGAGDDLPGQSRVPVPDECRTGRLLMRAWRSGDAERLLPVLEANRDHLGPWIPARVAEPVPLAALRERLERFAANFAAAREWRYGLFTPDGERVLGEMSLFPRDASGRVPYAVAGGVELGYWLRGDATGQGFATEATRMALAIADALPRFAFAEIRCDARNHRSAAVPRRLGFELAAIPPQVVGTADPMPDGQQVWRRVLRPDGR